MMNNLSPAPIVVPLSLAAHRLAQKFCAHHTDPQKARQVYLNTMAVAAVQFYLQCMEIETDWAASQSCDPVMQAMLNVADLAVPQGSLECLPMLAGDEAVCIPPEVWTDRVGYVAVRLDDALRQAELLGFTVAAAATVPVFELRSLKELLPHLNAIPAARMAAARMPAARMSAASVKLTDWLSHGKAWAEAGWQVVESLGSPSLAFSFRSEAQLAEAARVKPIDLETQLGHQSVALLIAIAPGIAADSASEAPVQAPVEILVQVHPTQGRLYLPADLSLKMLSDTGLLFQETRSREHDHYIQLRQFRGVPGECFEIRLTCRDASIVETFTI